MIDKGSVKGRSAGRGARLITVAALFLFGSCATLVQDQTAEQAAPQESADEIAARLSDPTAAIGSLSNNFVIWVSWLP